MSMSASTAERASAELQGLSHREIELLAAAYRVMARVGSHRLNLQDIADEAGTSKGLVLYHFKTKSQVLQRAMQWALLRTAGRIREAVEHARAIDDADELAHLLAAIFVSPAANREFQLVYLDLIERAAREPDDFAALPALTREIVESVYAEVIRSGVARGTYAVEDVDEAARTMRTVIDGTFLQWLQRDDWEAAHAAFRDRCHDLLVALLSPASGAVVTAPADRVASGL